MRFCHGEPSPQFQSLKGFQPRWNVYANIDNPPSYAFQSLKGFQPRWNNDIHSVECIRELVSIPKRVSAKVEPTTQSTIARRSLLFQSLKGFQPRWNDALVFLQKSIQPVSIPKRVSAKVEPILNEAAASAK